MQMVTLVIDLPSMRSALIRHGYRSRVTDVGYLVHAFMADLFACKAPSLFRVAETRGRQLEVLAYSELSAQELRSVANDRDRVPPPIEGKPVLDEMPAGSEFGFSLVACPVVRMASAGESHRKGAEVDVFLRESWKTEPGQSLDREEVYRDWLLHQFRRHGGAEILQCRVVRMCQRRLLRKTQSKTRKIQLRNKPEVELSGRLRVTDGEQFVKLLWRGIGRHRAFGLGMLLLRDDSLPGGQ